MALVGNSEPFCDPEVFQSANVSPPRVADLSNKKPTADCRWQGTKRVLKGCSPKGVRFTNKNEMGISIHKS